MYRFLVATDFHLTEKPLEEYRWEVFSWLRELSMKYKPLSLYFLGDLTHEKDRHSARLVNRVVRELKALSNTGMTVVLLKGNHDYVEEDLPFFDFLRSDNTGDEYFISKPEVLDQKGEEYSYLFLPHTKNPEADWKPFKGTEVDFVFCHQLFSGVKLGTGVDTSEMGTPGGIFKKLGIKGKVVSGDIHIPQKVGPVLYCGAPHPITFADDYEPRVLLWDGEKFKSLPRPKPYVKRHLLKITKLESFENWETDPGDQVKIELSLGREEAALWEEWKIEAEKIAEKKGVTICGFKVSLFKKLKADMKAGCVQIPKDPGTVLMKFCEDGGLEELLYEVGRELIKEG